MVTYALGGGAGSGMGAELMSRIAWDHNLKLLITSALYPH